MSIIFQLFSAEDLQKLDKDELEALRNEIGEVLANAGLSKEGKLHLNLGPKLEPDGESPSDLHPQPKWVQEALLKRFYEVSHQLKTPPLDLSQQSFDFYNLIRQRNNANTQTKEELILNWAISCELNHIEFYYALLKAREGVNKFYEKNPDAKKKLLTKEQLLARYVPLQEVRTKEPDSAYSPFNPRHPLYRQYYEISRSDSGTTGQTPPSRSARPTIDLVQLVQLLVAKGVISDQEYARLTHS
jgi:hypothetical protein